MLPDIVRKALLAIGLMILIAPPVRAQPDGYCFLMESPYDKQVQLFTLCNEKNICLTRKHYKLVAMREKSLNVFYDSDVFRQLLDILLHVQLPALGCAMPETMMFSGYYINDLYFAAKLVKSDGWSDRRMIHHPKLDAFGVKETR